MRRVRPHMRQLVYVLISCVVLGALRFTGAAQGCSVQSLAEGLCSVELSLSMRVREDHRVPEMDETLLVTLATLQSEPVRISHIVPTPPPLMGISYLTIQRLMLAPPSEESSEPQAIWDFGRVAQLEARLRDIDAFVRAVLQKLAQDPAAASREMTLVLSVDSPEEFLPTQIETLSSFALDERLHLSLSRATITLRTAIGLSSVMGQIELDPKDFEISKEQIGLELSLGAASLSGVTTFEQGVGLISQVYSIKAQVGNVELIGQAVFTSTSQEFTIGASIAGLALSGTSLITPSGFTQSVFIQIPIIVSPPKK